MEIKLTPELKSVDTSYHIILKNDKKTQLVSGISILQKEFTVLSKVEETFNNLKLFGILGTAKRSILLEYKQEKQFPLEGFRKLGNAVAKSAKSISQETILIDLHSIISLEDVKNNSEDDCIGAFVEGFLLGNYHYDDYKTQEKNKNKDKKKVKTLFIYSSPENKSAKQNSINEAEIISTSQIFTRNLVNAPSNELTPRELANRANSSAKKYKYGCEVLNKKQIQTLKMGGLLGVNKGSVNEPVFIVLNHKAKSKNAPTVVLVGKAITFDTGGISIKPAPGMGEMKGDMAGGGAVVGTLEAAARLKLNVNLIGIIPSTDNMPSGSAMCPGDILTTMSGITIEVDNTDAEGRLILADGLHYAKRFKPDYIIDLATLTGACVVSLAHLAAGLMTNNDVLREELYKSGIKTNERVWNLPLWDEYADLIKSDVADVKNVGGRWGGAITAGKFLQKFVDENQAWAHLDIAGPALLESSDHYKSKGGSGYGVRLLIDFLKHLK